jgi:integrase
MRQTPIYDLVTVAYETAARTGNVLGLRWEDHVDWEAQAVVWQPGEVKNRRRVVVPLTKRLKDVLLSRWPGPGASGWVFPSSEGLEQHISNQAFRIAWKDAIALANESLGATERIPATFRVYNLRHTRATLLLKSTGDPVIVAELLGDTVKMVLDRYAGRDATNLREALAKLDAVPTAVPKRYPIERDSAPQDPTGGEPN